MINLNLISFPSLPTLAAPSAPAGNLPARQNRHHRKQTGKGYHPELVDNRIAAGNSRCETESQCGHKGNGDGRRRHPARVVGQGEEILVGVNGLKDHDDVARSDVKM